MLRTILKEVKEFKRASIATPIYMILEVLMEMLIPFLMASIIDQGVNAGNIHHIYTCGRQCLITFRHFHLQILIVSAQQVW